MTLPTLRFPRSILSLTIVRRGLAGLVDVITSSTRSLPMRCSSFGIDFPGWPTKLVGREALWLCMRLWRGYGVAWLRRARGEHFQTPGVVILEYEVRATQSLRQALRKPLHLGLSR